MSANTQKADEEKEKKSKKPYIIIGGVVVFIILLVVANVRQKNLDKKAAEEASLAAQQSQIEEQVETTTAPQLSRAEQEQLALIKTYGDPPKGFRWDKRGNLVAISDETLTAEEIMYQYLRALSILDMANASKYASNSTVIDTYEAYFSDRASSSYYTQFFRKMYAQALLSIEIEGVDHEAVFADGRRIFTVNLSVLDLSDKTFWMEDEEEVYLQMWDYIVNEQDSTKAQQYIYDLILEYYTSGEAKKREVQVDIVLDKVTRGGWLVSSDTDLNMCCSYDDGTTVYDYVFELYSDWARKYSRDLSKGLVTAKKVSEETTESTTKSDVEETTEDTSITDESVQADNSEQNTQSDTQSAEQVSQSDTDANNGSNEEGATDALTQS